MAYAFVRTVDANSGTAQSGATATIALTSMASGNYVFLNIQVSSDTRTISSITDTASGTWTLIGTDNDGSNIKYFLYYCKSLAGAAPTVTVTWDSSAANNVYLWADEYTGLDNTAVVDQSGTDGNTSVASINPTTSATTHQPDILYCGAMSSNGSNARPLTTPASMTRRANLAIGANATQRCSYDQRLTATGTQSVTVAVTGGNSSIVSAIAAFAESGAGGGRLFRGAVDLDGLGGMGTKRFNPSL
jgi:hypothetical protein